MALLRDDALKAEVQTDEQQTGRKFSFDGSSDELDAAYRRVEQREAREHKDARWLACAYTSWFVAWFLLCVAISLEKGIVVGVLIITTGALLLVGVVPVMGIFERRRQTLENWYLETGHNPHPPLVPRNTVIGFAIASGWSALCFLLTCYYFWRRSQDDPDTLSSRMTLAWFIYFGGMVLLTATVLVIIGLVTLWTRYQRSLGVDNDWMQDFDPRFGPDFPLISSPPSYPMGVCHADFSDEDTRRFTRAIRVAVVESLVPYSVCFTSSALACYGAAYSRWFLLALLGTCVGAYFLYKSMGRISIERRQLRLYQQWHERFLPGEPLDAMTVALIKQRNDIGNKYLAPLLCMLITWFMGFETVLRARGSTTWVASSVILIGNFVVFDYWKRDLMELFRRR